MHTAAVVNNGVSKFGKPSGCLIVTDMIVRLLQSQTQGAPDAHDSPWLTVSCSATWQAACDTQHKSQGRLHETTHR